jgi:hypothetical protein
VNLPLRYHVEFISPSHGCVLLFRQVATQARGREAECGTLVPARIKMLLLPTQPRRRQGKTDRRDRCQATLTPQRVNQGHRGRNVMQCNQEEKKGDASARIRPSQSDRRCLPVLCCPANTMRTSTRIVLPGLMTAAAHRTSASRIGKCFGVFSPKTKPWGFRLVHVSQQNKRCRPAWWSLRI